MHRQVVYHNFLHWQDLNQDYENIFVFYKYLQTIEMIIDCLDLIHVVQQITALLYLVRKKLAANEENVW